MKPRSRYEMILIAMKWFRVLQSTERGNKDIQPVLKEWLGKMSGVREGEVYQKKETGGNRLTFLKERWTQRNSTTRVGKVITVGVSLTLLEGEIRITIRGQVGKVCVR